jgi:hypothetical protein
MASNLFSVFDISRCNFDSQEFALVVNDGMQLEAACRTTLPEPRRSAA